MRHDGDDAEATARMVNGAPKLKAELKAELKGMGALSTSPDELERSPRSFVTLFEWRGT